MMLTLAQGDTGTTLEGLVSANITGATVTVHILNPDATTTSKNATVTDGIVGAWEITWGVGDLDQIGVHTVEVEVVFADGSRQTFVLGHDNEPVQFTVRRLRAA